MKGIGFVLEHQAISTQCADQLCITFELISRNVVVVVVVVVVAVVVKNRILMKLSNNTSLKANQARLRDDHGFIGLIYIITITKRFSHFF